LVNASFKGVGMKLTTALITAALSLASGFATAQDSSEEDTYIPDDADTETPPESSTEPEETAPDDAY
jgi:hypothetical protein